MFRFLKALFVVALVWTLCIAPSFALAGEPVNINTATVEELISLPGIGPVIAERIIKYREKYPFRIKEDIMQVKGIGPVKCERLKSLITVE
ncbi:ComEA family DNA-binding protein [Desulfovulcanus ferrireducens]|uniref:ComEA family DNA-binding protein n=1 Tax=Desulfovulcanus ferrireducens TaxID=2831190 RepID=UPI00207BA5DB|nr:ComEA family DNA-binding protein [Desulfovulcanus ferrireducens]